jgi:hypothetical protein
MLSSLDYIITQNYKQAERKYLPRNPCRQDPYHQLKKKLLNNNVLFILIIYAKEILILLLSQNVYNFLFLVFNYTPMSNNKHPCSQEQMLQHTMKHVSTEVATPSM